MGQRGKTNIDALRYRLAALESVVIDLVKLSAFHDPEGLGEILSREPVGPAANETDPPRLLGGASRRRRERLLRAANVRSP